MDLAIFLGLTSALLYGITDFVARFANRETGVLRTMLWGQAFLAAVLTIIVLVNCKMPTRPPGDWLVLTVSNLAVVAGTGCLYRGLSVGRLTVVSPLMACYGAIGAVLSFATGEKFAIAALGGLLLAGAGAVLSASSGKKADKAKSSGWLPALGAAGFYGVGFWMQGKYVIPAFGPIVALWIYYVTASAATALVSLVRKVDLRLASVKDGALVLGTAMLAGGGYAALAAGQTTGKIAIVTALSAASTAITVILAFLFLKEKPGIKGWIGVAGVAFGVALLHLAQS